MYGMLLESIEHYLKEIYGEDVWNKITALAGVENRVFVTHHQYSEELFLKLADGAVEVLGKDTGWEKKDFMKFFGKCFVTFFSNYGYDRIVRVTGRSLGAFLNSIDNIHEHMRFGYPKMESPSFYCEDETSTGLSLHYLSKRRGFQYYVIGQIEQVVREFFPMEIEITILGYPQTTHNTHVIYRLYFDNHSSKPQIIPKALSPSRRTLPKCFSLENFFKIFPFSFVISREMKLTLAGSYVVAALGDHVLGANVRDVFVLRRPKMEFIWDNLQRNRVIFELVSKFPTKCQPPASYAKQCQNPNGNENAKPDFKKLCCQSPADVINNGYHSDTKDTIGNGYHSDKKDTIGNGYHSDKESKCRSNRLNGISLHSNNTIINGRSEVTTNSKIENRTEETWTESEKDSKILPRKSSIKPKNGLIERKDCLLKSNNAKMQTKITKKQTGTSTNLTLNITSHESVDNEGDQTTLKRQRNLHLKGEMKYIQSWGKVLFVCSPVISGLDEMIDLGLFMSDLGIYDRSQEMVLSGIKPLPQLEYARDQQKDKSEELEENLRKLEEERKRSDELLYRMIPRPVADRLKNGAKPIDTCEYFESVTVLFSYLDGFINLCSSVDAMEVVTLVNQMFVIFDNLSEKYDVYKFETLGDAVYMAVSGAPVRKVRHAEPVAAMALSMMESMKMFLKDHIMHPLTLTIGMHSGTTAAGIVGQKMPQYCLFGDTVNIAARLRTTSLPMRIHISDCCNTCLKDTEYQTEYRGYISLKGLKEEMKTHWLIGRKEDNNTK